MGGCGGIGQSYDGQADGSVRRRAAPGARRQARGEGGSQYPARFSPFHRERHGEIGVQAGSSD